MVYPKCVKLFFFFSVKILGFEAPPQSEEKSGMEGGGQL